MAALFSTEKRIIMGARSSALIAIFAIFIAAPAGAQQQKVDFTQFVVMDRRRLDARLSSHGETRVLDLRP